MRKKQSQAKHKVQGLLKGAKSRSKGKPENSDDWSNRDVESLVHELRVHQAELEAQNAKLGTAHLELEESRNRYADLYDFAPVGYFTLSEKGVILEVNLKGASLLGVERSNLLRHPFSQYVDKEYDGVFSSSKRKLFETAARHACELRMLRKDQSRFYARLEGIVTLDKTGNSKNIKVAVTDITVQKRMEEMLLRAYGDLEVRVKERTGELEQAKQTLESEFAGRVRAEKALIEKEEQYRNLFENVPIGLYRTTPDGSIIMANPTLVRMLGCISFEELASHNLENSEGYGPAYPRSHFKELIEREGEIRSLESAWTKRDGTVIFARENARVARGADGSILYYEGTLEDITERKRAEESFRLVIESAPNGIVVVNERGEITLVNSQTEKMFGYDRKELLGESVEILIPESFRRRHSEYRIGFHDDPRARPMGAGRDLFALRKDGSEFPVEIGLNPIKTAGRVLILSSIVDITERKRAEEVQRESEERLQAIMDNTTDAILVYDEQGRVITANKQCESLFSGNGEKNIKTVWDIIPSEYHARFSDKLKTVKEGNRLLDYDMEKILANGERIPVSVGLVYVSDRGGSRFIETIRDIKERVALRNKLIELEKAQLIGRMAEGVAHHMGTPLASMLLRVQMLKEDILRVPEHQDLMAKLVSVEKQVFYGQKVMQRLLRFAARPEKEGLPDNVSSLLEEAAEMIRPLLKRQGIDLELSLDESLNVLADGNLLGLVFMDVMMNSVDAMPEGGKLSIFVSESIPEKQIEIVMSDTGTGISEDIIPFVFEPFFSTKPAGKGTGLGLSVAKRIIHDHGGEISLESEKGRGTTVFIRLPVYSEEKDFGSN